MNQEIINQNNTVTTVENNVQLQNTVPVQQIPVAQTVNTTEPANDTTQPAVQEADPTTNESVQENKESDNTEKVFILNKDPVHIDLDQESIDRMNQQMANTTQLTDQANDTQEELPKEQTGAIQF